MAKEGEPREVSANCSRAVVRNVGEILVGADLARSDAEAGALAVLRSMTSSTLVVLYG